jgi:hypothetical protein
MCNVQNLSEIYRKLSYLGSQDSKPKNTNEPSLYDQETLEEEESMRLYKQIIHEYNQIKDQLVTEFNLEKVQNTRDHYIMKMSLAEKDTMHLFEPEQTIFLHFNHSYDVDSPCVLINMKDNLNNRCIPKNLGEDYKTARGDFPFIRDVINQFIQKWKKRYAYAIEFIAEAKKKGYELRKKDDKQLAFFLTKDDNAFSVHLQFNAQFQPAQSPDCADATLIYKTDTRKLHRKTIEDVTAKKLLALIISDIAAHTSH